jgi:hypothetical protein
VILKLTDFFSIPEEIKHSRVEVIVRTLSSEDEGTPPKPRVNLEILKKFRDRAEAGEFKKHLQKCLDEGFKFDFDAQKIIDGTETEEEREARYKSHKRAWSEAACEKFERSK